MSSWRIMENSYKKETFFEYVGGIINIMSFLLDISNLLKNIRWQYYALLGSVIYFISSSIKTNKMKKIINNMLPKIYFCGKFLEINEEDINVCAIFKNKPFDEKSKSTSPKAEKVNAHISYYDKQINELLYIESVVWCPVKYSHPKNMDEIKANGLMDFDPDDSQKKLYILKYVLDKQGESLYGIGNIQDYRERNFGITAKYSNINTKNPYILVELFARVTELKFIFDVNIIDGKPDIKELLDKKLYKRIISKRTQMKELQKNA